MKVEFSSEGCLDFRIDKLNGRVSTRKSHTWHVKMMRLHKGMCMRPRCLSRTASGLENLDRAPIVSSLCLGRTLGGPRWIGRLLRKESRLGLISREHFSEVYCAHSSSSEGFQEGLHEAPEEGSGVEGSSLDGFEKALDVSEREAHHLSDTEASTSGRTAESDKGSNNFMRVPWRGAVIWQVMMLWTFAYVIHPQWIIPIGLELLAGIDRAQLSSRGEALLHVALDLGMLGFTVGILWLCLKQYKPRALGWFRSRVWPPKWMLKVLLACAIGFPLAMYLGDFSQLLVPTTDAEVWNYLHLEETLAAGDKITNIMYFLVLTICAPVWEEVIFRGFLMPSLTKYMPPWSAVSLTALIFACVHFSCQRFLPLLVLGIVFGGLYAESKNLLAAITAHSLWNMCVFAQVLFDTPPGQKLAI